MINPFKPPHSPVGDDSPPRRRLPRLKRILVGVVSVGVMSWSVFATYMLVFVRQPHDQLAWLLVMIGLIFGIGLAMFWIAIRGTDKDVDDVRF